MATLRVNGQERTYDGDPSMPLLWYLRDELALTGTKFGCGAALCGNCTVHVDGNAVRSCVTPMSTVAGKAVTTIEGLSAKGDHPVQKAWAKLKPEQPVFFSIHGTGEAEAVALVRRELGIQPYDLMEDAILAAVKAAQ